jgi:hypothetical protein
MQPFSTDGCSLFPNRSLISNADWCECCIAHDLAYWQGGTRDERTRADHDLKACVEAKTGNKTLADLMHAGVHLGGGPYFFTPYHWGYGWAYGHGYAPLTASEKEAASALEAAYFERNPSLSCVKR